jgi:hypothetical protein
MTTRRQTILALLGAASLFALNWYICGKLARIEYLRDMHSIEGAYVAISRYAMQNWGDLAWFPLWYGGIPYQNTYPPLLHLVVAAWAWLTGLSPAGSYHAVNACLYCLGPVTLGWLAWRWSRSFGCGLFAGLLYSLISPSAFLVANIRGDLGGLWHARRLHTLVFYGDGPFVASLTLVPVALVSLDLAVKKRGPLWYFLAAAAMAAVVLTNWLGAATLAFAVLACLVASDEPRRAWAVTSGTSVLAYALASPWIPPSTIDAVRVNAQTIGGHFEMTWRHLGYAGVTAALVLVLHLLFKKMRTAPYVRAALLFLLFTGGVTLCAEWAGVFLAPQPHRYHLAMEMALSIAVTFLLQPLWQWAPARGRWVALLSILALSLGQAHHLRRFAQDLIQPIDIRTTTEYKTAQWFDGNMRGSRVMAPGSTSLFLNIFTDTPQLGGGFDQGVTNWQNRVAVYTIYSGENAGALDGEISVVWLKAFGVRAVAIGGPASGEHYKPFRNPRKFEGLLPEVYRDGDDYIYVVPSRTDSLAHVVREGDLVRKAPVHGLDVDQVRRYVAALEDPGFPAARMDWLSRHSARIVAELRKDQLLSVQVTYHPGWRAMVNGGRRRVFADRIGLMAIEPECEGRCSIDLIYDGGTEMKAAKAASLAGLLGSLAWAALSRQRRKRGGRV